MKSTLPAILFLFSWFCVDAQDLYAQTWYSLGNGVQTQEQYYTGNIVTSLAVDSTTHLLYAGGYFYYAGDTISPNLAVWDGEKWLPVTTSSSDDQVDALLMDHDTLIVAGKGGITKYYNNKSYSTAHFGGPAYSIAVYHDTLYAGGKEGILKFVNKKWILVDSLNPVPASVTALCVYKDQLIVGGGFNKIGDLAVNNIASWDGKHWHKLGDGTKYTGQQNSGAVYDLAVCRDTLVAGGYFKDENGVPSIFTFKWDGQQWSTMPGICGPTLGLYADSIHGIYATGEFSLGSFECQANRLARWNGNSWADVGIGSFTNVGECLTFFNNDLILGGNFKSAGGISANNIVGFKSGIATNVQTTTKQELQLYPNPAQDEVNVSFPFSNNIITISDLFGRELMQWKMESGKLKMVDVNFLHQGVYLVEIKDEKGNVVALEKLFKE